MPITATGALGTLSYNGFEFGPYTETMGCAIKPIEDEAKRTVIYSLFTFDFRTLIYGRPTDYAVEYARRCLSKPGGPFQLKSRGWGDLSCNVGGAKDVMWGPKPREVKLRYQGGENATEIRWTLEVALTDCVQVQTGAFAVLEFNYKLTFGIDRSGYTTRRHSGFITIPQTRRTQADRRVYDSADRFRENCLPPPLLGFRRLERTFDLSADRSRLDFAVTDEQMGPNIPPPGVIDAKVSHDVASTGLGFSKWVHTFSGDYEIAPGFPTGSTAVKAFNGICRDRTEFMDEQLNRSPKSNDKGKVIPVSFAMKESDIYGRPQAYMSASYMRVGDYKSMLNNSGLWRPAPDSDWRKWTTSISDVFGPRGHAKLVFDPGADDRIIDLCDSTPQISSFPRGISPDEPRGFPIELRNERPPPDHSWADFQSWIEIEDDQGTVIVKKLPESAPISTSLSSSGSGSLGGAQAAGPGSSGGSGSSGIVLRTGSENGYIQLPPWFDQFLPNNPALVELLDSFSSVPAVPSPGSTTPVASRSDAPTAAVRRGSPIVYAYLVGRALRAGYTVPRPKLESINGQAPIPANRPDRGETFRTACVANCGVPLYAATWRLRYALPNPPAGGTPTPPNPLYGG